MTKMRTKAGRIGTVNITGLNEVFAKLDRMKKDVRDAIEKRALRKALEPVYWAAIGKAPVGQTGSLANSFKLSVQRQESSRYAGMVKNVAAHAHLVELGFIHWRDKQKKPGQAFLRPAFDENLKQVEETFLKEVDFGMGGVSDR